MWSILERYKQNRARRRYLPGPRKRGSGTITKLALLALAFIMVIMAALQMRDGGSDTAALITAMREDAKPSLDVIADGAAARRLIFLADVPAAAAPKQLAAQLIDRLAHGSGLDIVALEIDAAEQTAIDRYLATPEEDASILLSRPRITHEAEGVSRAYTEVLRAVRRMNDELGADQQIRIVALDAPGWPPARALSPGAAAQLYGQRDSLMFAAIEPFLNVDPKARVLFFMGGLHALKDGTGVIQTGGTRTVETRPLAARLAALYPQDVWSVLVDATPSRLPGAAVAAYRGTAAGTILRDAGVPAGRGLHVGPAFNFSRQPIQVVEKPGIHFDLTPHDLDFTALADAYVYLGG
jgi:erythromycin esterase-like protein